MKKNRRFIYGVLCGLIILLFALFIIGYTKVNRKYPEAINEKYNIGEMFEYDGCDISVRDYSILNKTEAINSGYYVEDDADYKILKCTLEATNNSDSEKSPELYYIEAESSVWHNGIDLEVIDNANQATDSLRPTLKSGETATVTIAFVMYKFQFSDARWKRIDSDNIYLVFSLYPVKKYVVLQDKTI
ncbi:MAG: DUF5067 domain-containing protein [Tyzzerella sp.]|nr:DUF5067 domain-containing protein [Tyzzerella sp.]